MIDRVEAKSDGVKFSLWVDRERKAQLVIFNPRVRAWELRRDRELRRLQQRLPAYAIAHTDFDCSIVIGRIPIGALSSCPHSGVLINLGQGNPALDRSQNQHFVKPVYFRCWPRAVWLAMML